VPWLGMGGGGGACVPLAILPSTSQQAAGSRAGVGESQDWGGVWSAQADAQPAHGAMGHREGTGRAVCTF